VFRLRASFPIEVVAVSPLEPVDASITRSPLQAVADAVARHYKEQFGKGPQRCRAYFAGREGILVVLEGTMTAAERRLTELGEGERIRGNRAALRAAVDADLVATVDEVAGRRVDHAVSGLDAERDVATELFLLAAPAEPPREVV
jgi:uncharacterized protein YbcI